jgi:hypothetical protein
MPHRFDKYKGIRPGAVIKRELKKLNLDSLSFALSQPEDPQKIYNTLKGNIDLGSIQAAKIEDAIYLLAGCLAKLRGAYNVEQQKRKDRAHIHPNFDILRPILFWDTKLANIDWNRQASAVILFR